MGIIRDGRPRFGANLTVVRDWQPSTELKQQPVSSFYKPELDVIAKRYHQLRASKDEQALQRFIEEQKTSALQRFNVRVRS